MTETPKKRRLNWKNAVSTALFLILLVLLGWYVRAHWDEMRKLLSLSAATVALLLAWAW
jgi:hypothetical protein